MSKNALNIYQYKDMRELKTEIRNHGWNKKGVLDPEDIDKIVIYVEKVLRSE